MIAHFLKQFPESFEAEFAVDFSTLPLIQIELVKVTLKESEFSFSKLHKENWLLSKF